MYYNQLVADKASMEGITLNKRRQAQLLGILFAEYQILTTEQASIIRQEMDKPSNVFTDSNSLWAFYNYVTIALQYSHPRTWMEDQRILHYFINTVIAQSKPAPVVVEEEPEVEEEVVVVDPLYVIPNQTNILDQITELEQVQYPLTPDDAFPPVQEEVNYADDLHQSEEIIEDVIEDTEVPFDIDKDDNTVLGSLLVPIEKTDTHEDVYAEISVEEDLLPPGLLDEAILKYTDPAGNTFEAPIVIDEFALEDNLEEANFDELEVEEEKIEVDNSADFDLDFVSDDTEEDEDEIPDFF
jgi:hypothetical protein